MRLAKQQLWSRVRRFPRVMFTAAARGDAARGTDLETARKMDSHTFSVPGRNRTILVKYPRERALMRATCGRSSLAERE